jgi:hypothetical protein
LSPAHAAQGGAPSASALRGPPRAVGLAPKVELCTPATFARYGTCQTPINSPPSNPRWPDAKRPSAQVVRPLTHDRGQSKDRYGAHVTSVAGGGGMSNVGRFQFVIMRLVLLGRHLCHDHDRSVWNLIVCPCSPEWICHGVAASLRGRFLGSQRCRSKRHAGLFRQAEVPAV